MSRNSRAARQTLVATEPPTSAGRPIDGLIVPHGGFLRSLVVDGPVAADLKGRSRDFVSWDLTVHQLCDLELLLNGGFSPLTGFLTRTDYDSVRTSMRLADGTLWPIPVTLDMPSSVAARLECGDRVALRDPEGVMVAVLQVEDVWRPDGRKDYCIGGVVSGLELPAHYDFRVRRATPAELRAEFKRRGWHRVIAVQACRPLHKAEYDSTCRAAIDLGAKLLIHSVVETAAADFNYFSRVRCHEALLRAYPAGMAHLALLPLARRAPGLRQTIWQAIVAKNHGCSHLMIGGEEDEQEGDAVELVQRHVDELGVRLIPFRIESGFDRSDLHKRLAVGEELPEWFTFPEIASELRRQYPARAQQGCTIFFTGLSGSGKSTVANVLRTQLLESGSRRAVTLLDGDLVRKHLSSELGFSKEHRDINIRRIGFVASEITKNGGFAICAPIAPYDAVRKDVRRMIAPLGGFVLVHVATPLEVCEERDRKGLYAKARAGIVKEFTGISDPYESPEDADVVIDTTCLSPQEAADRIFAYLAQEGYLG